MEKRSGLIKELVQLDPLIGRWTFKGSFKNNPGKLVDGWETYVVIDDGSAILCEGETRTILSGSVVDVYKNTMRIVFDKEEKKIIGGDEWVFSIDEGILVLQNSRHRFTGKINESKEVITGKWENKSTSGGWIYWYDKVLTKAK